MEQTNKTLNVARDIWTFVGITLLTFLLVEGFLSLAFRVKEGLSRDSTAFVDDRAKADAYEDRSWVASYYEEFERSQIAQWKPYVYWRQQPYQGTYINITEEGLRFTPSPSATRQSGTAPLRILMFGGSTLWGTGARDSMTIPAILARELANKGITAEVTNFGESGYVNTQELVGLLLELQQDKIPDLVIFYDGVNDTFSAYQQGVAGIPQNEFNRVTEFALITPPNRTKLWFMAFRNAFHSLSTVRFLEGLFRRSGVIGQRRAMNISAVASSQVDYDALAHDVVAKYKNNTKVINVLARQYGFKSFFYWQPTIFQKKHLTEYESLWRQDARPMESFFLRTYALVQESIATHETDPQVRDLSLIFLNVREPLYVDWCHLAELGNTLVAKKIASDVFSVISPKVTSTAK
jgi:hypothetical protein